MSFNPFLEKVLSLYFYIVDFLLWYWRAPITLSCFHERPLNQLLNRKLFDSNWIKEKDDSFKIWHEFIQEALYLDHLALPIRPTPQVTSTQQCNKLIWKSIKRSIGQSSSHFQDHLQSILIDPKINHHHLSDLQAFSLVQTMRHILTKHQWDCYDWWCW